MFQGDFAQLEGKLVRLTLARGWPKDRVGVFLEQDSETIRISELASSNHFYVLTVPKADIARVRTIDLNTGDWPPP